MLITWSHRYDPPGGQSYSWYENVESKVTFKHDEFTAYNGGYAKVSKRMLAAKPSLGSYTCLLVG